MSQIVGTHLDVRFSRVVDGDTIRVFLPGQPSDESLRILALDTEESQAGGSKPETPWGKKAKERATEFFQGAANVSIEFPGNEDLQTCLTKYRGNFGRLLVFVYRDDVDYQQTMIDEGFSPYFSKYGNAAFAGHHQRYKQAERGAQRKNIGVWDQFTVNGSERRNYAALGTWWKLRARVIDEYRKVRARDPSLLNSRLDYAKIEEMARDNQPATVFTEIRSVQRVGGQSGLIGIGSIQQPFSLFIPDIDADEGQELLRLLENRYISSGEDRPRQSYAYVTGQLSMSRDRPQMVLSSAAQVTDQVPEGRQDSVLPSVSIVALLPNPAGSDPGNERVTLRNTGQSTVSLQGWILQDLANNRVELDGQLGTGQDREISLAAGQMPLNNAGDEVFLFDADGKVRSHVSYSASDVQSGNSILFS